MKKKSKKFLFLENYLENDVLLNSNELKQEEIEVMEKDNNGFIKGNGDISVLLLNIVYKFTH